MFKQFSRKARGNATIQLCTLLFIGTMVGAFAIDMGLNYTAQDQLQTVADAAALAGANELLRTDSASSATKQQDAIDSALEYGQENLNISTMDSDDVILGYIDPLTRTYDKSTFTTPTNDSDYAATGGYNAVRVKIKAGNDGEGTPVPSIMGQMFGVANMNTVATAVAFSDNNVGELTDGLRPIYTCAAQFTQANSDGDLSNDTIRIYGDEFQVNGTQLTLADGCPPPGSGNWGFADLRDSAPGSPGNSTLASWWEDGFSANPVEAGSYYSTQPGNSINSNNVTTALDTLMNNNTVFAVPLIDEDYTGNGSNTQVHVVGFAGFQITNYSASGNNSWIEGKFVRKVCNNNCSSSDDGSAVGGGMIKLRLAR